MASKNIDGVNVTVDDKDADLLNRIRWRIAPNGYVYATVYLHRLIAKAPLDKHVDHVDRDKANNSRKNLEVVTPQENMARRSMSDVNGRRGKQPSHSSKFVGVCYSPRLGKWRATFRRKQLGVFKTEEEAAAAHRDAVESYLREIRSCN